MHISSLTSKPPKPNSIRRNAAFNFIGCLVYQGCQWLVTVLVAVIAGYQESGLFAYAAAIGNLFLPIATFNLRTFQVSDLNNRYSSGEYIAFRSFSIIIAFFCMIPYILLTSSDISYVAPAAVFLFFKADEALCDVFSGIHQKWQRMDYIGISQFARGVALLLVFSTSLYLLNNLCLSIALMFLVCFTITLLYDFPHVRRFGDISIQIDRIAFFRLVKIGLPLVLSATFASSIVTLARQYFGNIYGSEMLGIYASIATPAVLIQAASRYIYSPLLVPLADSFRVGEGQRFRRSLVKSYLYLCIGMICLAVPLLCFGPIGLSLIYGSDISPYLSILPGMVFATSLNALLLFTIDILVIVRDLLGQVIVSLLGMLICVLVCGYCINSFFMDGINLATSLSFLAATIFAFLRLRTRI